MTKSIRLALALIIVGTILGVFSVTTFKTSPVDAAENNLLTSCTSASSTAATSGSTAVVATSTARRYVRISNDDPAAEVYLSVGNAPVRGQGIHLEANDQFVMDLDNMAYGAIYAVASGTAANLAVFSCK